VLPALEIFINNNIKGRDWGIATYEEELRSLLVPLESPTEVSTTIVLLPRFQFLELRMSLMTSQV
jgi:hypothetical protein